jgi:hypothetical protein
VKGSGVWLIGWDSNDSYKSCPNIAVRATTNHLCR